MFTIYNLMLGFTFKLGAGQRSDANLGFTLNAIFLIYVLLAGVKQGFDVDEPMYKACQ